MTVIHYTSDEAGAPTLNNAAGALLAVLDACLVNGFNSKSCTISVTAGVATVTAAAHGYVTPRKVLIEGATPAGLNGVKEILSVATNTYTFDATGIADGAATGTITCKRAPLGWSIAYTGTNKRIYARTAVESTAMMLRVLDTAASPASTSGARAFGVESASGIDTYTGQFPTNTQIADGQWWEKGPNSATAKFWILVGDERLFYLFVRTGAVGSQWFGHAFGDPLAYDTSDPYCCVCIGNSSSTGTGGFYSRYLMNVQNSGLSSVGFAVPRDHTRSGTAQLGGWLEVSVPNSYTQGPQAPSPINGRVQFLGNPYFINATQAGASVTSQPLRGELPGLRFPVHNNVDNYFSEGRIFPVSSTMPRRVVIAKLYSIPGVDMPIGIEIDGPWR